MATNIHERETLPDPEEAEADTSRRHRPATEARFPSVAPLSGVTTREVLSDHLRADLWEVIAALFFAPHPEFDTWTSGVAGRPSVMRLWSAPPLSGDPELVREDVAEVVEGWFSLVEPGEAFAFVETAHESLEPSSQHRFVAACNLVLERASSEYRFVLRRLVPIASKSDIATVERAIAACKRATLEQVAQQLHAALARLATKPHCESRGAVQESIRAVESAAFVLTGARHLGLDDALEDLEERGYIDGAFKAAYSGLFGFAGGQRQTTPDDARLIFVMCASLVTHLATFVKFDAASATTTSR